MKLEDLEVCRLAREIPEDVWEIYQRMDYQIKRIMGGQFIISEFEKFRNN